MFVVFSNRGQSDYAPPCFSCRILTSAQSMIRWNHPLYIWFIFCPVRETKHFFFGSGPSEVLTFGPAAAEVSVFFSLTNYILIKGDSGCLAHKWLNKTEREEKLLFNNSFSFVLTIIRKIQNQLALFQHRFSLKICSKERQKVSKKF